MNTTLEEHFTSFHVQKSEVDGKKTYTVDIQNRPVRTHLNCRYVKAVIDLIIKDCEDKEHTKRKRTDLSDVEIDIKGDKEEFKRMVKLLNQETEKEHYAKSRAIRQGMKKDYTVPWSILGSLALGDLFYRGVDEPLKLISWGVGLIVGGALGYFLGKSNFNLRMNEIFPNAEKDRDYGIILSKL